MPLPTQMVNRWERRTDLGPGQAQLYWHILFNEHPHVQALASIGQEKLASFSGLHFTPLQCLHITTFTLGPEVHLTTAEIEHMVTQARRLTSKLFPVKITLGKLLYHPEAIVLNVSPADALDPVQKAIREAMESVVSSSERLNYTHWTPHVTLAYSTAHQPATPIVAALGRELPSCEVVINSVSLVLQAGPERLWNWRTLAEVKLAKDSQR